MEFYCLDQSGHKFCGQRMARKVFSSLSLRRNDIFENRNLHQTNQGLENKCLLFLDYIVRTDSLTWTLKAHKDFTYCWMISMQKQEKKKVRKVEQCFPELTFIPHFRSWSSTGYGVCFSFIPMLSLQFCNFQKPRQRCRIAIHEEANGPTGVCHMLNIQTEDMLLPCKRAWISKDNT